MVNKKEDKGILRGKDVEIEKRDRGIEQQERREGVRESTKQL